MLVIPRGAKWVIPCDEIGLHHWTRLGYIMGHNWIISQGATGLYHGIQLIGLPGRKQLGYTILHNWIIL